MTRPITALALDGVDFDYPGRPVLRGIDLRVADGETLGIVGPNGSGKSTLLRVMAGTLRPSAGRVALFDKPMEAYPRLEAARYIGYVAQDAAPAFGYTAGEYVMLGRRPYQGLWPFDNEEDERLARRAMADTETEAFVDRSLLELSGGERRRVMIAAALSQEPSILLLDEPTAALDLHYQLQIHNLLAELNRTRTITVILVTHDLNLAALFCPRVLVIDAGRIVADGPPVDVFTPERLRAVYGVRVTRGEHPDGRPYYVPFPDEWRTP